MQLCWRELAFYALLLRQFSVNFQKTVVQLRNVLLFIKGKSVDNSNNVVAGCAHVDIKFIFHNCIFVHRAIFKIK